MIENAYKNLASKVYHCYFLATEFVFCEQSAFYEVFSQKIMYAFYLQLFAYALANLKTHTHAYKTMKKNQI